MGSKAWALVTSSFWGFLEDEALSRAAAMAFFAVTSLAPIILIVIAIAGLVFGHDAARDALASQLTGLMGEGSAQVLQDIVKSASNEESGTFAAVIGLVTLLITASGVFGEMQNSLNVIWKAQPKGTSVSRLVKARATSLGLVGTLGFLLIVSLAVSAALSALGGRLTASLPFGETVMTAVNELVSFAMITVLFAAIYKVLPDRRLEWRDVRVGAAVTALLFMVGKSLIGFYIGSSAVGSSYGAAGALIVVLLWVYYSSLIFLFGAEFTRAYSVSHGSRGDLAEKLTPAAVAAQDQRPAPVAKPSSRSPFASAAMLALYGLTLLRQTRRRT
ncbi:YihY/virulence factor BrkB family protein [Mesorhizobium sp. RP14(2022)]|uniref:YihY/virulence factor BrkB family protein n=1 Tax=Mesorhizobium liriopis TaxID=2953882 RepID=A0ABT1CAQ1_9HYPH|nr:YihY/virulence factor BrkB family protein [Mesorhizobium liriopis]MCO6051894.1 YihY/virulence factor BrkB family protein [Mesorhizobium liriopis]